MDKMLWRCMMQFEVIEYKKDESGKEKQVSSYNVEQFDLSRTIEHLNEDVKNCRISRYEIAEV
jgi:hypothetical protein